MLVPAFRSPLSTLATIEEFIDTNDCPSSDGDSEANVCDHRAGLALPQPGAPAAGGDGDGASQAGRCQSTIHPLTD